MDNNQDEAKGRTTDTDRYMTEGQLKHIGMTNSYNILIGKVAVHEVIDSGIGFLFHDIDHPTPIQIKKIIAYFSSVNMFEHSAEMRDYLDENFTKSGKPIYIECKCEMPLIVDYTFKMRCARCKNRLKL